MWPVAGIEITEYIHEKFENHDMVRKAHGNAEVTLSTEGTVTKKALRFPVSVVAALELAVKAEDRLPAGARVLAWARLLKIYGALRMDDLQRLHPKNVTMKEAGFSGRLTRTKCFGPGKKVRELFLFVPASLGVAVPDWLRKGYELWMKSAPFPRSTGILRLVDFCPEAGVDE